MVKRKYFDFYQSGEKDVEFRSATARNVEEARELVESGFSYVCDIEGVKLFRKRK